MPRPVSIGLTVLGTLFVADALHIRTPGGGLVRTLLLDSWVYTAVRAGVVLMVVAFVTVFIAIVAWLTASVVAHMKHRGWVRKIGGYEPDTVHRGARDIDEGTAKLRAVIAEQADTNAALTAALERTNARLEVMERELSRASGGTLF